MKKSLIFLFAVFAAIAGGFYVYAAEKSDNGGKSVTIAKTPAPFSKVKLSGVMSVFYTQSEKYSLNIRVNEAYKDRLVIKENNGVLSLGLKGIKDKDSDNKSANIVVNISSPRLTSIEMSGVTSMKCGSLSMPNDELEIELSGVTNLKFDELKVKELDAELSGVSSLTASGFSAVKTDIEQSGVSSSTIDGVTNRLELEVSGTSTAKLSNLTAKTGEVEVSGCGSATTHILSVVKSDISGLGKFKNR